MERKLSVREQLLQRANAVKLSAMVAVPAFAADLARLWQHMSQAPSSSDTETASRIRKVLENNRAKVETRGHSVLMERLANALPAPALSVSTKGIVWNEALATMFTDAPDRQATIREELKPLLRIIDGSIDVDLPNFLYPLADQVFSIRVVRLPDTGLTLTYFLPTGLSVSRIPFLARFTLCARLSGLAAKQIARLCDENVYKIETVSKRHRSEFLLLKEQMVSP